MKSGFSTCVDVERDRLATTMRTLRSSALRTLAALMLACGGASSACRKATMTPARPDHDQVQFDAARNADTAEAWLDFIEAHPRSRFVASGDALLRLFDALARRPLDVSVVSACKRVLANEPLAERIRDAAADGSRPNRFAGLQGSAGTAFTGSFAPAWLSSMWGAQGEHWRQASNDSTEPALQMFLDAWSEYPQSKILVEARAQWRHAADSRECDQAMAIVRAQPSVAGYQSIIARWPDSPNARLAVSEGVEHLPPSFGVCIETRRRANATTAWVVRVEIGERAAFVVKDESGDFLEVGLGGMTASARRASVHVAAPYLVPFPPLSCAVVFLPEPDRALTPVESAERLARDYGTLGQRAHSCIRGLPRMWGVVAADAFETCESPLEASRIGVIASWVLPEQARNIALETAWRNLRRVPFGMPYPEVGAYRKQQHLVLRRLRAAEYFESLGDMIDAGGDDVVAFADLVETLGAIGDPCDLLRAHLERAKYPRANDRGEPERLARRDAVVAALGRAGHEHAIDLIELFASTEVAAAAFASIGGERSRQALLESVVRGARTTAHADAAIALGVEPMSLAATVLAPSTESFETVDDLDARWPDVVFVAHVMSASKDRGAISTLASADDPLQRCVAAWAISAGDSLGEPEFVRLLGDAHAAVRDTCIRGLASARGDGADELLARFATADLDEGLRVRALISLARSKSDRFLELIRACLHRVPVETMAQAVELHGESALEELLRAVDTDLARAAEVLAILAEDHPSAARFMDAAMRSRNIDVVAVCHAYFIREGSPDSEALLIEVLHQRGDRRMASAYLSSGNARLESAARSWAEAKGYVIVVQSVLVNRVRWGASR